MPLLTTTIGAYPKPDYVPTPDWFRGESTTDPHPTRGYDAFIGGGSENVESLLDRGTREVVLEQVQDGSTTVAKLSNMVAAARAFS